MYPFKQANNVVVFGKCTNLCKHQHHLILHFHHPKGELVFTGQSSEGPRSQIAQIPKPERPTEAGASVSGPSSQVQTVRGLELLTTAHPSAITESHAWLKDPRQMPKLWTADRQLLDRPTSGQALPGPFVPLKCVPASDTHVKGHSSSLAAPKSGHTHVFQSTLP